LLEIANDAADYAAVFPTSTLTHKSDVSTALRDRPKHKPLLASCQDGIFCCHQPISSKAVALDPLDYA